MIEPMVVYTDGSGLATRGAGGVGFVAVLPGGGRMIEGSLSLPAATSQQAEILAAAYALDQLDACSGIVVWSDSQYVVSGMSRWMQGWRTRGWRTAAGKPVKNQAHWARLVEAESKHERVEFSWCRGHDGNEMNERAHELATAARLAQRYSEEGLEFFSYDEAFEVGTRRDR